MQRRASKVLKDQGIKLSVGPEDPKLRRPPLVSAMLIVDLLGPDDIPELRFLDRPVIRAVDTRRKGSQRSCNPKSRS